ncbi:CgeB family protein [Xanthobacter wiegelii]|uniref:hypothetical protein n=1 Tax=Xanthobacter wiegelii TaxID=3119913 RepID=UPI00372908D9
MKLLLIGFPVFNYIDSISAEAKLLGYDVTYYNIEPWSNYRKVLRRASPARFAALRDREQKDIIAREAKTDYDVVLFIQCHQFSAENLKELRRTQPRAHFVLYNWDSIKTFDYSPFIPLFDKVYTFDHADAERLKVGYLPLFCIRELQPSGPSHAEKRRVYFVGKVEGIRRYMPIRRFKDYCRTHGIEFDCTMVAARWRVYLELLRRGVVATDLSRRSISKTELRAIMDKASAVFDYANYEQTGFTMRVMENLCAGKKLITASRNIRHESFYSPDRIFILENDNFDGIDKFLDAEIKDQGGSMEEFYVQNFTKKLLAA